MLIGVAVMMKLITEKATTDAATATRNVGYRTTTASGRASPPAAVVGTSAAR